MNQDAVMFRLRHYSKEPQADVCKCHAGGVSNVGVVILGYAEGNPPFCCWCSVGRAMSRHRKDLKSLGGVHIDDAAE